MNDRAGTTPPGSLPPAPASASSYEEAVLIAGGPVAWPRRVEAEPHVPDLAFVRERMPERTDRNAYLVHALRFFEDVLAYAERLATEGWTPLEFYAFIVRSLGLPARFHFDGSEWVGDGPFTKPVPQSILDLLEAQGV